MHQTSIVGAILTGGRSSRMGSPKPEVSVAGGSMASWVTGAMIAALPTSALMAVGHDPIAGAGRVADGSGEGPRAGLAGLAAAWDSLHGQPAGAFITAIDHPWLRPETITGLIDRFANRPVIPVHQDVRQVLCAVYPAWFLKAAAAGRSGIQAVLDTTDFDAVSQDEWQEWGEDGRSWFSVDRPEDIAIGLERYGAPG